VYANFVYFLIRPNELDDLPDLVEPESGDTSGDSDNDDDDIDDDEMESNDNSDKEVIMTFKLDECFKIL